VEQKAFNMEGRTVRVTASLGVATFAQGQGCATEEDMVQHADANLYLAKKYGRNRCWTDEDGEMLESASSEPSEAMRKEPIPA